MVDLDTKNKHLFCMSSVYLSISARATKPLRQPSSNARTYFGRRSCSLNGFR